MLEIQLSIIFSFLRFVFVSVTGGSGRNQTNKQTKKTTNKRLHSVPGDVPAVASLFHCHNRQKPTTCDGQSTNKNQQQQKTVGSAKRYILYVDFFLSSRLLLFFIALFCGLRRVVAALRWSSCRLSS